VNDDDGSHKSDSHEALPIISWQNHAQNHILVVSCDMLDVVDLVNIICSSSLLAFCCLLKDVCHRSRNIHYSQINTTTKRASIEWTKTSLSDSSEKACRDNAATTTSSEFEDQKKTWDENWNDVDVVVLAFCWSLMEPSKSYDESASKICVDSRSTIRVYVNIMEIVIGVIGLQAKGFTSKRTASSKQAQSSSIVIEAI